MRLLTILLAIAVALVPGMLVAQEFNLIGGGLLVRVDGDVTIAADEEVETLVVVDGDARIEGRVDTVVVVDGTAVLRGAEVNDLVVVSGDAVLEAGTRIHGDVHLADSSLDRASDVVVSGKIRDDIDVSFPLLSFALFSLIMYLGFSIFVVLAGLLAAGVAARQVRAAGAAITDDTGWTILGAIIAFVAVPIAAVFVFFTVVGIPTALGVLIFALPALWFMGYLVTGVLIGGTALNITSGDETEGKPLLQAVVGLVALQIVGLIPVLGVVVVTFSGLLGGGAVALVGWRALRGSAAGERPAAHDVSRRRARGPARRPPSVCLAGRGAR